MIIVMLFDSLVWPRVSQNRTFAISLHAIYFSLSLCLCLSVSLCRSRPPPAPLILLCFHLCLFLHPLSLSPWLTLTFRVSDSFRVSLLTSLCNCLAPSVCTTHCLSFIIDINCCAGCSFCGVFCSLCLIAYSMQGRFVFYSVLSVIWNVSSIAPPQEWRVDIIRLGVHSITIVKFIAGIILYSSFCPHGSLSLSFSVSLSFCLCLCLSVCFARSLFDPEKPLYGGQVVGILNPAIILIWL